MPLQNYFIIGVTGRANVGKDSLVQILTKCILAELPQILAKNIHLLHESDVIIENLAKMTGGNKEVIEKSKRSIQDMRWILEQYGTNYLGESLVSEHIINNVLNIINEANENKQFHIIFLLIRALKQRAFAKSYNGIVIRIRRESEDSLRAAYPSELQIERMNPDLVINNEWSFLRFEKMVEDLFKSEILPKIKTTLNLT